MNKILFVIIMILFASNAQSQTPDYYNLHDSIKEPVIKDRFFKHSDIEPIILGLENHADFVVTHLGESIQGRSINLVKWGNGPKTVLMWSQMHGDEPTATMALMDIFRLFQSDLPEFESAKQKLQNELTILFIPMLNPDGAQSFKRRNALEVDLNRDALRLTNPEARILKEVRDKYNPLFGFNLHDQNIYYSAGNEGDPVAIAFLAPAYNHEKDVNDVRLRAMQLIGAMHESLLPHIEGKIAKYDDTFEPRAFGDNIQRWGTSTILVESGGYPDDPEKQYLRKLNFLLLMSSLSHIANDSYKKYTAEDYNDIPYNRFNAIHDFLIKNATVEMSGVTYTLDLGWRGNRISDIGDLSINNAYEIFDADGYTIRLLGDSLEIRPQFAAPGSNPILLLEKKSELEAIITDGKIHWIEK
jgi:hypothetical protein